MPQHAGIGGDLLAISVGTLLWAVVCFGMLKVTGSRLPEQLQRRKAA